MHNLYTLLQTALYMIFVQNLVFSGGYGSSEAIRMSTKPRRFGLFAVMIAFYSTVTALVCRVLDRLPQVGSLGNAAHILVFGGVLLCIYFLTVLLLHVLFHPGRKFFNTLGIAALNTMVFAVPLINRQTGFTVLQSAGTGIGSAFSFILALYLVNVGLRRLDNNQDIPPLFRGTPAMFLYVAMLSLAFAGLSGRALFA